MSFSPPDSLAVPAPHEADGARRWAALAICCALLAACGGKDPDENANAAPSAQPAVDGEQRTVRSADGQSIRYRMYGSGAPVLVFIHGWAADSTYWEAQVGHFKNTHTVVTLDLAGHGESVGKRQAWTMDAFGDDVVAVAEQISEPDLVLIGHSMGGPVAVQAARRLRGRVLGIVGVETFSTIGLNPPTPAELERRLEPFRRDFPGAARTYVLKGYFTPNTDPALVQRIADGLASAPPDVAIGEMIGMNEMNYPAALADIDVPIIAINGTRVPTNVARIRLHAPTFRLKPFEGAGHYLMLEQPQRFNALLEQTLAELLDPAAAQ